MPILPAILSAIPSVFQAIEGIGQRKRGQRILDNLVRPEYNMPNEVNQNLALAQARYGDPYSVSEQNARRDIGVSAANAIAAGQLTGNLSGMVPAIAGNESQNYNRLQAQVEQDRVQRQHDLMNMRGEVGKYKDLTWQLNQFAPYMQKYNEGREMVGAGTQNIYSSLNGLGSIGALLAAQPRTDTYISPTDAAGAVSRILNGAQDTSNGIADWQYRAISKAF